MIIIKTFYACVSFDNIFHIVDTDSNNFLETNINEDFFNIVKEWISSITNSNYTLILVNCNSNSQVYNSIFGFMSKEDNLIDIGNLPTKLLYTIEHHDEFLFKSKLPIYLPTTISIVDKNDINSLFITASFIDSVKKLTEEELMLLIGSMILDDERSDFLHGFGKMEVLKFFSKMNFEDIFKITFIDFCKGISITPNSPRIIMYDNYLSIFKKNHTHADLIINKLLHNAPKKCFIICSKDNYCNIPPIEKFLKENGINPIMPNSYDEPYKENKMKKCAGYVDWKSDMIKHSAEVIKNTDFLLVLNITTKKGINYIGGATLLEMYEGFRQNKPIFVLNPLASTMFYDELVGLKTICLNGDIKNIVKTQS